MSTRQERGLLRLLTESQSAMARLFQHRAKALGLSPPQWRVLAGLHGREGLTQTELSEQIAIARSPLGKIVDQLEELGYVLREDDPDDRRIHRLHLTESVMPLFEPAEEVVRSLEDAVLRELKDRTAFLQSLADVNERLQSMVSGELSH